MKKIFLLCFVPFLFATGVIFFLRNDVDAFVFKEKPAQKPDSTSNYIEDFSINPSNEFLFLNSGVSSDNIFLIGSSELSTKTKAVPYHFISEHFNTRVIGLGHAGNQCLSIYSMLLANEDCLTDARVVIILSPGWFHSEPSKGTTSSVFLNYVTPHMLQKIYQNDSSGIFRDYETSRIADFYDELINPDLSTRLLYFEHRTSLSILHRCVYFPMQSLDKKLYQFGLMQEKPVVHKKTRPPIMPEDVNINWDSLLLASKNEQIQSATNNQWGIENDYYDEYIKGRKSGITLVSESANQELRDFYMLIQLLKTKKVNASFVILPLNPYYYVNLKEMTPLITTLENEITENNFPCLNFWQDDSLNYEKEILSDVMHLSDHGWYRVDRFIVETYKLSK